MTGSTRMALGATAMAVLDLLLWRATGGQAAGPLGAFRAGVLILPPAVVGAYLVRRQAGFREVTATALLAATAVSLLAGWQRPGAAAGGVGLVLAAGAVGAWAATGMRWFP